MLFLRDLCRSFLRILLGYPSPPTNAKPSNTWRPLEQALAISRAGLGSALPATVNNPEKMTRQNDHFGRFSRG
jgi:hypothetical protein